MHILRGHRTQDIIKIVRRRDLPDSQDELFVEEFLPPPKLIKFGAVERLRSLQGIIPLHTARLLIGGLAIELHKLDPKCSTLPSHEFVRIECGSDIEQTIKTPFPRFCATGEKNIGVTNPNTAQKDRKSVV